MNSRVAFGAITLALLFTAPGARAANFYVSPTGNDGFPGNQGQPFQTLRKAANVAQAGDTVFLRGGTYTGPLNPEHAGTASAWITFTAFPGELPVLDGTGTATGLSGVEPTDLETDYIRLVGIVARNWPSSGFSNGFNFPSAHVEFRNCIADGNGINGIAFYKTSGVLITESIIAHNGNQLPSWSSGVNLFTVTGSATDNQVVGNVSFENIDVSTTHSTPTGRATDGSGFILDSNSTGALFENNIGFRNGGSCIRLTNSSGAHIINNTCYHDALDTNDGSPANPAEIHFSDSKSATGVVVANNLLAGTFAAMNQTSGTGGSTFTANVSVDNGGDVSAFFAAPASADFHLLMGATLAVDQASAANAPATDVGFDARCIKAMGGQAVSFFSYAVDYDYVASVGGVAGCFHPGTRPAGAAPDIGAYEFGAIVPDAGAVPLPDAGTGSSGGARDASTGADSGGSGGGSSGARDAAASGGGSGSGSGSGSDAGSGSGSSGGANGASSSGSSGVASTSSGSGGTGSGAGGAASPGGASSGSGGSGSSSGGDDDAGAGGSMAGGGGGHGGCACGAAGASMTPGPVGLMAFVALAFGWIARRRGAAFAEGDGRGRRRPR